MQLLPNEEDDVDVETTLCPPPNNPDSKTQQSDMSFLHCSQALDKALQILTRMQERESEQNKMDEFDTFGQTIAHGLRKLKTDAAKAAAASKIYEILFKAIMANRNDLK